MKLIKLNIRVLITYILPVLFFMIHEPGVGQMSWYKPLIPPKHTKDEPVVIDSTLGLGWFFGLNTGFYFPDNRSANFYNGSGENDIKIVLDNYYYEQQIVQEINHTYKIPDYDDLPQKMRYDVAMNVGFYARFNFIYNSGIFIQFNYVKLTASDVFILEYDSVSYLTFDNFEQCAIWGKEERVDIDVGFSRIFDLRPKTKWILEAGVNFNNITVIENKIGIGDLQYNIKNTYRSTTYVPNSNFEDYNIRQGGVGYGTFINNGIQLVFSEKLSMDPGIILYWKKVNLPGYENFGFSFSPYVRFTFKNIFW